MEIDESVRAAELLQAQARATALFEEISGAGILRPGVRDSEASRAVTELAADRFGVREHWHKRIVRSGPNTLQPYRVDPPDRVMIDGDIVFADFGPVFVGWEADFGRTWVLGDDPGSCASVTISSWSSPRVSATSTPTGTSLQPSST